MGLTLETLYEKSNLNEASAKKLFSRIDKYESVLTDLLPELKKQQQVEQVILGVHHGHKRLAQLAENLHQNFKPRSIPSLPWMLGADDHLVAAYKKRNTLIADAGSHGSFNVMDIDRSGRVLSSSAHAATTTTTTGLTHQSDSGSHPAVLSSLASTASALVLHVAITPESAEHINPAEFVLGRVSVNSANAEVIYSDFEIARYDQRVKTFIEKANEYLQTPLVETLGIKTHKRHMKKGRTDLGSTLSEALVLWVKSMPLFQGIKEPVIAMLNSSSYRVEAPIERGVITEFTFREHKG